MLRRIIFQTFPFNVYENLFYIEPIANRRESQSCAIIDLFFYYNDNILRILPLQCKILYNLQLTQRIISHYHSSRWNVIRTQNSEIVININNFSNFIFMKIFLIMLYLVLLNKSYKIKNLEYLQPN